MPFVRNAECCCFAETGIDMLRYSSVRVSVLSLLLLLLNSIRCTTRSVVVVVVCPSARRGIALSSRTRNIATGDIILISRTTKNACYASLLLLLLLLLLLCIHDCCDMLSLRRYHPAYCTSVASSSLVARRSS